LGILAATAATTGNATAVGDAATFEYVTTGLSGWR
jgi:hypothetical protein